MKYAKYIEVNQTGTVDGKPVRCCEITEEKRSEWKELDCPSVCEYYNCAFKNMLPCVVPCLPNERKDGKAVYYELNLPKLPF